MTKVNKKIQIQNYLFNQVQKGTMICKITAVNTKKGSLNFMQPNQYDSSKSLSNCQIPNLLKTKLKQIKDQGGEINKKRIDLEIVMLSEEFFEFLPKV